ncbi:MAG: hypothetical protein GY772_31850 [bacterium]|nr:hypothetical protein [bacterium]
MEVPSPGSPKGRKQDRRRHERHWARRERTLAEKLLAGGLREERQRDRRWARVSSVSGLTTARPRRKRQPQPTPLPRRTTSPAARAAARDTPVAEKPGVPRNVGADKKFVRRVLYLAHTYFVPAEDAKPRRRRRELPVLVWRQPTRDRNREQHALNGNEGPRRTRREQ